MFRKSLLLATAAAAAAASVAAPVSAAEVKAAAYTDLRYGLAYFNDRPDTGNPSDTALNNNGSYYGFKGSAEQGGIVVFGAYEKWLDSDGSLGLGDLVRQGYAGVKTAYGSLQFGTFGTAYMESGRKLDPFYATGAAGIGNPATGFLGIKLSGGQSHGMSSLTADQPAAILLTPLVGGFVRNQVQYTTPSIMGLTVNAGVAFDEVPGSNMDDYSAGLEYNGMGITAGVQYLDSNGDNGSGVSNFGLGRRDEAYRVYGAYNQQRWGANVSAERIDSNTPFQPNADYLMVSGWYGVMEGTRVAASYGMENEAADLFTGTSEEGTSFRVGLFYDVLDNFTTHVAYRNFNAKSSDFWGTSPDDQVVELGASFKFELSGTTNTR